MFLPCLSLWNSGRKAEFCFFLERVRNENILSPEVEGMKNNQIH